MRLIVTRPEPDASRTARALIRLGHEAILCPMLDIETLRNVAIARHSYQAVITTSSNAVRALSGLVDRPVPLATTLLAVGDSTALEAKRAGFGAARSAGGALSDLVALAGSELSPEAGPLLHVTGEDRAGDLSAELGALGFSVETAVLYRASPRRRLAEVAEKALRSNEADGVLLYSRRSAETFAGALRASGLAPLSERITCFCLSAAVAEALPAVVRGPVAIAEKPDQISLFALIEAAAAMRRQGDREASE